jgi:hypothetical protein
MLCKARPNSSRYRRLEQGNEEDRHRRNIGLGEGVRVYRFPVEVFEQ